MQGCFHMGLTQVQIPTHFTEKTSTLSLHHLAKIDARWPPLVCLLNLTVLCFRAASLLDDDAKKENDMIAHKL